MKMTKKEAIEYLEDKGEITGRTKYSKVEEAKIKKVMKNGKIYGDPLVELS
jgi:hypothetical protein